MSLKELHHAASDMQGNINIPLPFHSSTCCFPANSDCIYCLWSISFSLSSHTFSIVIIDRAAVCYGPPVEHNVHIKNVCLWAKSNLFVIFWYFTLHYQLAFLCSGSSFKRVIFIDDMNSQYELFVEKYFTHFTQSLLKYFHQSAAWWAKLPVVMPLLNWCRADYFNLLLSIFISEISVYCLYFFFLFWWWINPFPSDSSFNVFIPSFP